MEFEPDAGPMGTKILQLDIPTIGLESDADQNDQHLDEIDKLKHKVLSLQDANNSLHVSMRKMAMDMAKVEKQLDAEAKKHRQKRIEVISLQQEMGKLSAALEEPKVRTDTNRTLSKQHETTSNDEHRSMELQTTELSRLTTALLDKDSQLREKDQQLVKTQTMLEENARLSAQVQQEIQLREQTQKDLALLQQQTTTMADPGEMDDLRRQCAFYQKNSERLSKRLIAGNLSTPTASGLPADDGPRYGSYSKPKRRMPGHFAAQSIG